MLYYLAVALLPYAGAFNLFTYHTVRAGGAAFTGFFLCILAGPWIIRLLRQLKAGQYIKEDHVAELHTLHKGKAGTPTMGGVLIIFATLVSLAFWGLLSNRLLWLAVGVLVLLGIVGFIDDYIKMRRKHNDGMSARAKFAGQVLTGMLLGLYLVNNPITVSDKLVLNRDVLHWDVLVEQFHRGAEAPETHPRLARAFERLDAQTQTTILAMHERIQVAMQDDVEPPQAPDIWPESIIATADRAIALRGVNNMLEDPGLYDPALWALEGEAAALLGPGGTPPTDSDQLLRFNRLLLEEALPRSLARSVPDLHTKVGIPGFKDVHIPMGIFYVLFVIIILVSISNAVNITDGLDGLATGASVISIMAFAAIAYAVSRVDWSSYLFVTYVPEASELFVFGAALLGAGLGFLWYNCHPAEVFMGDTGSLALGGAIGTMAILTKQELLLPIVAGIFVLEIGSVVLQVGWFKFSGKRIFRMAPLHHHFELIGWSETKVVMRFWIVALLLALMSLATLKLR